MAWPGTTRPTARSDVTFWLAWVQAGLSPRWLSDLERVQAPSHPWGFGLEILGPKVTDGVAVGFKDVVMGHASVLVGAQCRAESLCLLWSPVPDGGGRDEEDDVSGPGAACQRAVGPGTGPARGGLPRAVGCR